MSDINKLVKATRMMPNIGLPKGYLTLLSPIQLERFRSKFFKRGGTKDKFIVKYDDMKNVVGWQQSVEYQERFKDHIPIIPFRKNGLFYMEFSIGKNGLSVPFTDEDAKGNCGYGISFDVESDDSYLFSVLHYDKEHGIGTSPFLEFQACEFQSYTGEEIDIQGAVDITNPTGQYKMNLRGTLNPNFTTDELKAMAQDFFQNWVSINHYILEFERNLKLITQKTTYTEQPKKGKKYKAPKGIQNIGSVYKVVFTDEELCQIKRDYNYTQPTGYRANRWAFYPVNEDYFARHPERLADTDNYRLPNQKELERYLSYGKPIGEGKIIIMILRKGGEQSTWNRSSHLLNHEDSVGFVPVTQRLSA